MDGAPAAGSMLPSPTAITPLPEVGLVLGHEGHHVDARAVGEVREPVSEKSGVGPTTSSTVRGGRVGEVTTRAG
jgi:hypothetical protein